MQAWQATVQDEAGNIVVNPAVSVYQEDGETLAVIYNENGTVKANPFIGSLEGFVQFWGDAGVYKVEGASGADRTEIWTVELASSLPPYSLFESYSEAVAARKPGVVQRIGFRVGDETYWIIKQDGGPCLGGWGRPDGSPKPQHFGAVFDAATDDGAAFEEWADYCNSLRRIFPQSFKTPSGRSVVGRPIVFECPSSQGFRSTLDMSQTEIMCNFNRADYPALIESGDRGNPSVYQAPLDIVGKLLIRRGPNCQYAPRAIERFGPAQCQISTIDTSSWDNCLLVDHGAQNTTYKDFIFYSGGYCFGFRDPAGMTASWGAGGILTIDTASTAVRFDSTWVGKLVSLHTTSSAYHTRIVSVTSATVAVTEEVNPITGSASYTAQRIVRTGSCAPRTTAGSSVVTLDGNDIIDSRLVGLLVAIPRAGAGGKMLIANIISVNTGARTITLDRNASVTLNPSVNPMTDTTEITTPVRAFLSDTDIGIYTNGQSQIRHYNTQFETFRGLVDLYDDAELVDYFGFKAHGVQTGYLWNIHAIGAIWGNRLGGKFYGECDARYYGRYRFRFASQTQTFSFHHLAGRMATFEKLLQVAPMASGSAGAVADFGTVTMLGCRAGNGFETLVDDENTVNAGYHPPSKFIKPDAGDITTYCGPMHRFEKGLDFSLGGGMVRYRSDIDRFTLPGRTIIQGQSASLEVWDSDVTGFTYLRFANNGGAVGGEIRHDTASGRIDFRTNAGTRFSVSDRGLNSVLQSFDSNGAALSGGLLPGDFYKDSSNFVKAVA